MCAKGRMLKTRISKSKKMGCLDNDSARLLYLMILPHTDIKGRFEADPVLVRNFCMPYFKDWDDNKIQACLELLNEVGLIILYVNGEDQYLQMVRFEDFQTIRKDREAESEIPDPPNIQPNSNQTTALSKVKLSKDKLIKTEDLPVDNLPSAVLQTELDHVFKDGLNIYALINKAKASIHQPKEWKFPEEVLLRVCKSYWDSKVDIKKPWAWFSRVLTQFSSEHFSNMNEKAGKVLKKDDRSPSNLGDIMKKMGVLG